MPPPGMISHFKTPECIGLIILSITRLCGLCAGMMSMHYCAEFVPLCVCMQSMCLYAENALIC